LVTRKPGTFDKSVRTIKLLRERRIPVRIAFHVQADNYNDAFALPAFAESLDADYDFDTKLVPNRNGSLEPLSFGITVEQQAMLHREGLIEKAYSLVCPAARSKIRITAAGDVYPCQLINTVSIGNMYTQSLDEIWGSPLRSKVRQEILDYTPHRCTKCSHTSDCLPCAAMRGFNQTSDHLSAPVSEACLLTASRLLADDLLLPEHIQSTDCFSNAMKSPSDLVQIRAF
jgi:radical SAM protein with 4Fe4S-binding SPASM domain